MKSGNSIHSLEPLPKVKANFIQVEELLALLTRTGAQSCSDTTVGPPVTLLDLRTENHLPTRQAVSVIKSDCPTVYCLLDDLQIEGVRQTIPKDGLVVTITETGNRDQFAIQYLSKYGYANVKGLMFGMRAWLKADYPVQSRVPPESP